MSQCFIWQTWSTLTYGKDRRLQFCDIHAILWPCCGSEGWLSASRRRIRIQSQSSTYRVCGRQSGTGLGLSLRRRSAVFPFQLSFHQRFILLSIIRCWYNRDSVSPHPNINSIQFFIPYVPNKQLRSQLKKEHSVDNISTGQISIIALQRKNSIKTTAPRPVSEVNCCFYLICQRKTKSNNKKNSTNKH
jgi:hypothetical protein